MYTLFTRVSIFININTMAQILGRGVKRKVETCYEHIRAVVGIAGTQERECKVMEHYNVTRGFVRYHTRKASTPGWHGGAWGGHGRTLFNDADQTVAEIALWTELRRAPGRSKKQIVRGIIDEWQIPVTLHWVSTTLKKWRYTNKKSTYRVISRYAIHNIVYYG
jgi:hypothetical protein